MNSPFKILLDKKVEPVYVSGPDNDYLWHPADSTSTVRLIWDIDGETMKTDLFNTLGGRPSSLMQEYARVRGLMHWIPHQSPIGENF